MTKSQDTDKKEFHPFFVILLIITESILTFLLRIDQTLRDVARPLVKHNSVVKVIVSKPNITFYAEFNKRGILLDFAKPEEVNPIATMKLPSLLRLDIFLSEKKMMQIIQFTGDIDVVERLKTILLHLSPMHMMNKWFALDQLEEKLMHFKQSMRSNKRKTGKAAQAERMLSHNSKALLEQINVHQKQLDSNAVALKERDYTIRQMQRKLRTTSIIAVILLLCTLALISFVAFHMFV